jgi:hypothetical protein
MSFVGYIAIPPTMTFCAEAVLAVATIAAIPAAASILFIMLILWS